MIYKFALNFDAATFGGIPRTVHQPGRNGLLRITKPKAALSGGLLQFDAWSAWDNDEGEGASDSPVPGQTWDNRFEIWASNGDAFELIWSAEDEGLDPDLYETEEDAWDAIDALLPLVFTGYDTYRVQSAFDDNPGDNRGGISLIVEMRSEEEGREIVTQSPETPISEVWQWLTDIGTAYDGTEELLPLLRYPRRSFSGSFMFDDIDDVRNHVALMLKNFDKEFRFPLFQYQAKLKTKAAAGTFELICNTLRGDFREDCEAFIVEGDTWEMVVPKTVEANRLVLQTQLMNSYTARAIVMPLAKVYSNTNASFTRLNPDKAGNSPFTFGERVPTLPFVSDLIDATVDTFDAFPILPYVATGTSFEGAIATGLQPVEYTGLVDLVSPWQASQWGYPVTFKADRMGGVDDLAWWRVFAEAVQGSSNPFLFPTNRSDLEVHTSAAAGGNQITVEGTYFSENFWGHGAYSRIFIDTDAGRHFARITGVTTIGGHDRLTFTPALPAGAAWANNQRVGFLLKVRIDDDKIKVDHYGLWSEVSLALRTVE